MDDDGRWAGYLLYHCTSLITAHRPLIGLEAFWMFICDPAPGGYIYGSLLIFGISRSPDTAIIIQLSISPPTTKHCTSPTRAAFPARPCRSLTRSTVHRLAKIRKRDVSVGRRHCCSIVHYHNCILTFAVSESAESLSSIAVVWPKDIRRTKGKLGSF